MNEAQLPLLLTVIAGLLLLWRVTVMTGFLPRSATLRLYRESFDVLRRHRWILLVFLIGCGATLLVTESQRMLATRKYRQTMVQPDVSAEKMPTPWSSIARRAVSQTLPSVATWCQVEPCGAMALWLAAILLFVYRRRVLPQLFPADRLAPTTLRWLKRLLWVSAGASWVMLVFGYIAIDLAGTWLRQPSLIAVALGLSLPVAAFQIVVTTYLACGLVNAAQHANAGNPAPPARLLEVSPDVFQQLLKLVVITNCLLILPVCILQIPRLIFIASRFVWISARLEVYMSFFYPALCLVVFPAVLFIVLEQAQWRKALRQTVDFWRHHAGEWLALLLPVFVLAFAVNFIKQWLSFYAAPFSSIRMVPSVVAQVVGAIAGAWWLVTIVRWWDSTKTRAGL